MLRSIGIPARLVAGFAPGEFNPFTGFYVVKNVDAYAMTEVYFPNYGWFPFDPIPGHELIPPTVEDYETFGVLKRFWNWVAGWLPSPVRGILAGLMTIVARGVGWAIAFVSSLLTRGWIGVLIGLALLTTLTFVGWLAWTIWQTVTHRLWLRKLPPMESLYQQMLDHLASSGFRKSSVQTPLEYAQSIQPHQNNEQFSVIEEISMAYVRWRYGKEEPEIAKLNQKWRSAIATNSTIPKLLRTLSSHS